MLKKVCGRRSAHRVQNDINPFPSREFCRGYEVCIASDKNNLIDLSFERECRDIETQLHVDTLLFGIDLEIFIRQHLPGRGK